MDLFGTLKEVTKNQIPWDNTEEDFKSAYSQFMINRFASSVSIYVLPLSEIDRFKVADRVHHQYITSFFHKKDHYFNYKAYKKPKSDIENSIKLISKYFEIGEKETEMYIELMTQEQIEDICSLYRTK